MRSLFPAPPPTPNDPPPPVNSATGWDRLKGSSKVILCLGVIGGLGAALAFPGLGSHNQPVTQPMPASLQPSLITEPEPPLPQSALTLVSNSTPNPFVRNTTRHVPAPTEMALYTGPTQVTGAAPAAARATGALASGENGIVGSGAVDPDDKLGSALTASAELGTMHATLARNNEFTIRAGEVIPCLPIDAQNSSRPGFSSCRVPKWYRGSDQSRGLLPPGTKIFGQIKNGVAAGERRLGILYTRIETPWANIRLAAPGADAMGRSGLDGDTQTFFWDKVQAVALYSLLDAAIGTGQNLASSSLSQALNGGSRGGGGSTLNFGGQAQGLASQEMASRTNKPPVLTRDQALPVTVTVGQDLDFTAACRLAMRVNPMACPLQ